MTVYTTFLVRGCERSTFLEFYMDSLEPANQKSKYKCQEGILGYRVSIDRFSIVRVCI